MHVLRVILEARKRRSSRRKRRPVDRKSTRLNSSHSQISYAVFCLKKKRSTICPSGVLIPKDCPSEIIFASLVVLSLRVLLSTSSFRYSFLFLLTNIAVLAFQDVDS